MSSLARTRPHTRAAAASATQYPGSLQQSMPFRIRGMRADAASEFAPKFTQDCDNLGWRLFVLPPSSAPNLNGVVVPGSQPHTEEFSSATHRLLSASCPLYAKFGEG